MAENKKSFVIYCDLIHTVSKLTDSDVGLLFNNILKYVNNNNNDLSLMSDVVCDVYLDIINQIEFEWSKYSPKTKKYHWNYKGGITDENKLIRNSTVYKIWRNKVFLRDSFTCQKCKIKGGVLNAHHIKPFSKHPELRTELSNGITLCEYCHKKEHSI